MAVKELCHRHGFSEASYYLRHNKLGGMGGVGRQTAESTGGENAGLDELLSESMLENEVTREALRKMW